MTRLHAHPIRVVLRFVASVMMVSGLLLLSDAGITLLWQEPVSAYFSERQQVKLEKALIDPPERVVRKEPLRGDAIGKLSIPSMAGDLGLTNAPIALTTNLAVTEPPSGSSRRQS